MSDQRARSRLADSNGNPGLDGGAPFESSFHELETVYRYNDGQNIEESLGTSTSLEFIPSLDKADEESGAGNDSDDNLETSAVAHKKDIRSHHSLPGNDRRFRIQKWLFHQEDSVENTGNTSMSTSATSVSSSRGMESDSPAAVTRDNSGNSVDQQNEFGSFYQHVKQDVNDLIEKAAKVAMSGREENADVSGRPSSMYFVSQGREPGGRTGESVIHATFRPRRSQSSLVMTPSLLILNGSRAPESERSARTHLPPQTYGENDEECESDMFVQDVNQNRHSSNPESIALLDDIDYAFSSIHEMDQADSDSIFDPSEWEYSTPSSAVDDQDITSRFNEFFEQNNEVQGWTNEDEFDDEDFEFLLRFML